MPVLDGRDPAAVVDAAQRLADGELVAFATETVYGLGARADDDVAVARIFALKGRPVGHPLIVHVAGPDAVHTFAAEWTPLAQRLAAAHWPGPLTIIVPRRAGVAAAAAGGQPTIGLRCPSHPVAQALLRQAAARGLPGVAAPSANRFGRVSPTTAAHVVAEFGPELTVLDGEACDVGIESAIVDCSRAQPVLLRPGVLGAAELAAAAGVPLAAPDAASPRAPGTLAAHYAPLARVELVSTAALMQALAAGAPELPAGLAVYSRSARALPALVWHRTMPDDARQAARELFAVMREVDAAGARRVWVEQPPADPAWDGVRDRLQRAAAASQHMEL